jgi:hypothetical protein
MSLQEEVSQKCNDPWAKLLEHGMQNMYLVRYDAEGDPQDPTYVLEYPREWSPEERLGALFLTALRAQLDIQIDHKDHLITVSHTLEGHPLVKLRAHTTVPTGECKIPVSRAVYIHLLTAAVTECARLQGHFCGLEVIKGKSASDYEADFRAAWEVGAKKE